VPEEVLRRYPSDDVIFAQFVRQPEQHRNVFTMSVPCGEDKGGRRVYLTALELLSTRSPCMPSPDGLPDQEMDCARRLNERLRGSSDPWTKSVDEMLRATKSPSYRSFCNLTLELSLCRPDWMPRRHLERMWDRAVTAAKEAGARLAKE
jgi:hypothetical protein